ncbi:unnamed protein product [Heterobilharzia americana]|nr:unnamed protein product [Heterobilharzia americana]
MVQNSVTENSDIKDTTLSTTFEQHLSTMNGISTLTDHFILLSLKDQKTNYPMKNDQTLDNLELNSMQRLIHELSDFLPNSLIQNNLRNNDVKMFRLNDEGNKNQSNILSEKQCEKFSSNFKASSPRVLSIRSPKASEKQFLHLQQSHLVGPYVVDNRRRTVCTSVIVEPDSKITTKAITLDTTVEDTDSISLNTNLEPGNQLIELTQTKSIERNEAPYSMKKISDNAAVSMINSMQHHECNEEKSEKFLNQCTSVLSQECAKIEQQPDSVSSIDVLRARLLQALQALQKEHTAYEELEAARDACEARIREMNLQNINLLSHMCTDQKANDVISTNEIAMNVELRNQLDRLKFELIEKKEQSEYFERELKNINEYYCKLNDQLIKSENEKEDLMIQVNQLMHRLKILQSENTKMEEVNEKLEKDIAQHSKTQEKFKKMKDNLSCYRRFLQMHQNTLNNGLKNVRLRIDDVKMLVSDMKQLYALNSNDVNSKVDNNKKKCDVSQVVNFIDDNNDKNEILQKTLNKKSQEFDYLTDAHRKLTACYNMVHKKLTGYLYNERLIYNNLTKLFTAYNPDIIINNNNNTAYDNQVISASDNSILYQLTSLLRIMGANQDLADDLASQLDSLRSNCEISTTEPVQQNDIQEVTLDELTSLGIKLSVTEKHLYELRKEHEDCLTEFKQCNEQLNLSKRVINQLKDELDQYKNLNHQFKQSSISTQTNCSDEQIFPSIKLDEHNPFVKELLNRLEQAEQKVSQLTYLNSTNTRKYSEENIEPLQTNNLESKGPQNKYDLVKSVKSLKSNDITPRTLNNKDENEDSHEVDQITTLRKRISELESDREWLYKENERLSERTEKQRRFTEKLTNRLCQSNVLQQIQQSQLNPLQPSIQQLPSFTYSLCTQPTLLLTQPVSNSIQHDSQSACVRPLCEWSVTSPSVSHRFNGVSEELPHHHDAIYIHLQ